MSDEKKGGYDFDSEDDDIFGDDPFGSAASQSEEGAKGPLGADGTSEDDAFEGFEGFGEEAKQSQQTPGERPRQKASLFSKDGMIDFLKENIIYIVGGIVVIIIAYYLLFGLIFSSPTQPAARPQQQQASQGFGVTTQVARVGQQQQAQEQEQQQQRSQDMALSRQDLKTLVDGFSRVVSTQTAALQKQIKEMQSSETSLKSGQSTLASSLANDDAQLKNITTQIASLNKNLGTFNQSINAITSDLKSTQSQLRLLLAQKTQARDQLTLRAVVPGRAWLVDKNGQTTTVAVGTMIPNYGKVEKIDSKSGTVIMSSGYVFN